MNSLSNHKKPALSPGLMTPLTPDFLETRHLRAELSIFRLLCSLSNSTAEPFSQNKLQAENPAACPGKASKRKVKLLTFWSLVPQKKTFMSDKDSLLYAGWTPTALAGVSPLTVYILYAPSPALTFNCGLRWALWLLPEPS